MYHRFVAGRVRAVFRQLNAGDYAPMVAGLARDFDYEFYGDHALAGHRTTKAAMEAWWQRAFRLMPDVKFELDEVLVAGWPWNTRIATTETVDGPLPDGSHYHNRVHQFIHMRWGKITRIRTLEDTHVLMNALDVIAASGNEEAYAAPITDKDAAVAGAKTAPGAQKS
jgi:ketosteroid isomerase-like protein